MKNRKILTVITIAVIILSALASSAGIFSGKAGSSESIVSVWGERIELDAQGLYSKDSVSIAAQGRAQDVVTLIIGIPLLLISFIMYSRGSRRGALLYSGTLAYFLYTYISYCFIVNFNQMFLVYTGLFALCLFGFIMVIMNLDVNLISAKMSPRFHRKTISIYLFTIGILILLMWLGRIVPALLNGTAPYGIDHYSTLGIQVLDLSIVVPVSIITSILLWRRKPWGYVLSGIVIFKALTLLLAIFAMIIAEYLNGVPMNPVEVTIFLAMIVANIGFTVSVFRAVL